MATLYALLSFWFNANITIDSIIDGNTTSDDVIKINQFVIELMYKYYSYFLLLTIPCCALATFVFFKKEKFNYMEHLVINAYIIAMQTLITIALLPVSLYFQSLDTYLFAYSVALLLTFRMYIQVFDSTPEQSRFFKTIGVYALSLIFSFMLGFILEILYVVCYLYIIGIH